MTQANIELHIEELVLHGFAPGDRLGISEAVKQELQQLFAEQSASPSWAQDGEYPLLEGGRFELAPGSKAETIGTRIAQAMYGELSG